AVGYRGFQPAEKAHVLVIEVYVHEPPQPGVVDQPLAQPVVPGLQVGEQLVQGGPGALDRLGPVRVAAQDRRDTDLDGHRQSSSAMRGQIRWMRPGWQAASG